MQSVREHIRKNKSHFEHFEYYTDVIGKAENNVEVHPDISIEASKALFEGVSKTIIVSLDSSKSEASFKTMGVDKIVKRALELLADKDDSFDLDFVKRSASVANLLGNIRNNRGDLSHGKVAPKLDRSTPAFAQLVLETTDALVSYVLKSFFALKIVKEVAADLEDDPERYDENPDFNDYLDEEYSYGTVSYSRALYSQDPVSYFYQLDEYNQGLEDDMGE